MTITVSRYQFVSTLYLPHFKEGRAMSTTILYKQLYEQGYGLMHPDGHIVRIYHHLLMKKLGLEGEDKTFFDFGCGNGIHAKFFASKGFNVYGVDVVEQSIHQAQEHLPAFAKQFKCIQTNEPVQAIFNTKFDVIFSNQVLYFLTDSELATYCKQFDEMLSPDGIVIFTMMTSNHYFYEYRASEEIDGRYAVDVPGKWVTPHSINFTQDEDDLLQKFALFQKVFTGYYDMSYFDGDIEAKSTKHFYFVGQKRNG
jgi:SAM-dependent methyltransferase